MAHSHVARLLLLSLAAGGVLAFTVQLDDRPQPAMVRGGAGRGHRASGRDRREPAPRPRGRPGDRWAGVRRSGAAGVVPGAATPRPDARRPDATRCRRCRPHRHPRPAERAARLQAARTDAGQPFGAGAAAPLGTPGISTLTSHVAPSCSGTGRDGNRVQVLYVHERRRLPAVRRRPDPAQRGRQRRRRVRRCPRARPAESAGCAGSATPPACPPSRTSRCRAARSAPTSSAPSPR